MLLVFKSSLGKDEVSVFRRQGVGGKAFRDGLICYYMADKACIGASGLN
jgi:hypothetical protein